MLPAPGPCHARLARPRPYPQDGELGSVGARRSMLARFTGCPGGAPTASSTHSVKAFAVRGLSRRPRARGRASVSSEHLDLFTGPARDRIAERARIRRQTRLAGRAKLVSVTTERTRDSDANGRIDDLRIGLNPPPTGNRFAKPMSALVVSYDARGRAVGPKWLLRVRPTGSFQRKRPREFKVAVRRVR